MWPSLPAPKTFRAPWNSTTIEQANVNAANTHSRPNIDHNSSPPQWAGELIKGIHNISEKLNKQDNKIDTIANRVNYLYKFLNINGS